MRFANINMIIVVLDSDRGVTDANLYVKYNKYI